MNKKEIFLEKNRIARLFGREVEESNFERNLFLLTLAKKQKLSSTIMERIYQLLKDNQEDIKTFKELQEEMQELISSLNKYQEAFSKEFSVNVKNFPVPVDEIKISNFEDIKFPALPEFPKIFKISNLEEIKIPKFPERIEIKKPSWFEKFDFIRLSKLFQNTAVSLAGQIKKIVYQAVIENTKPKEAIPVRLVTEDGERFYRAGDIYVTGGGGGIIPASSRKTYNVIMTSANTEYSQELPDNTKKFLIQCREASDVKVSTTEGESGTNYLTLRSGLSYYEDFIRPQSLTLYFQCVDPGKTAEIIAWR